jgi:uncharacterized membrane protein (DUF4010 family)
MAVPDALIEAGTALAIGLAVGFEREHHDLTRGVGDKDLPAAGANVDSPLGSRTLAIVALAGWLAAYLGDRYAAIAPLLIGGVVVLIGVQYVLAVKAGAPLGLTTEIAGVVVALLGMLVHVDRPLAVPLALALILLLVSKPWMHAAALRLRRIEILGTVQLLVLAAIVLPLLPSEPIDPWHAIPPRQVGLFVVIIGAIEYAGYVLHRTLGAKRGIGLAGLIGGVVSSTAVTAAMAREARAHPEMTGSYQLATLLANLVMGVRVVAITASLSTRVAWELAPAMAALVAVLGVAAIRRARGGGGDAPEVDVGLKNPFALVPALTWGAILCAVLLGSHFATEYFGDRGILLAAAASGLADVDAITLAASRQAGEGALAIDLAALAIAVAVASNSVVKAGIAIVGGGRRFGTGIAIALGLAVAAAAAAATIAYLV